MHLIHLIHDIPNPGRSPVLSLRTLTFEDNRGLPPTAAVVTATVNARVDAYNEAGHNYYNY